MTFADRMRILGFPLSGGLLMAVSIPFACLNGQFSPFPGNVGGILLGAVLFWGGAKLYLRAF